jgi:hypothetical protein
LIDKEIFVFKKVQNFDRANRGTNDAEMENALALPAASSSIYTIPKK